MDVPRNSWAAVHHWNTGPLKVYSSSAFDGVVNSNYNIEFSSTRANAHINLHADQDGIHVGWPDDGPAQPSGTPLIPRDLPLSPVLQRMAHFHFHLLRQRQRPNSLWSQLHSSDVKLKMYCLNGARVPFMSRNLFRNNLACLPATEKNPEPWYGLQICNSGPYNLYAYLFCFDPSNYTINVSPYFAAA
jgi:hypothetical protein